MGRSTAPKLDSGQLSTEWSRSLGSGYEALLSGFSRINSYRDPAMLFRALASELTNAGAFAEYPHSADDRGSVKETLDRAIRDSSGFECDYRIVRNET
jgi:hypothetical protein